jgi:predicted lipoprotein with Yx(FWY)xxD motif
MARKITAVGLAVVLLFFGAVSRANATVALITKHATRRDRSMRLSVISATVLLSVFAVACGSSSKPASQATTTTASTHASSATTATTATTGTAGAVVLNVVHNTKLNQQIVVNASTLTTYLYVPDGSSQTSTVPTALQAEWPKVTTTAANPTVATGLDQTKLHVNAAHQVSYNGHLLYTFKADLGPGSATGQGLGNVWYAIAPNGTPIK